MFAGHPLCQAQAVARIFFWQTTQRSWNVGLNYTAFFGKENTFTVTDPRTPTRMLSYGQTLKDRNYVALNISRTF